MLKRYLFVFLLIVFIYTISNSLFRENNVFNYFSLKNETYKKHKIYNDLLIRKKELKNKIFYFKEEICIDLLDEYAKRLFGYFAPGEVLMQE